MLAKSYKSDIVKPVIHWSFYDFVDSKNQIEEWYANELTDLGRFTFDTDLKNRAKTKNQLEWGGFETWRFGEAKDLGIWELKFSADGKQHRVFGIFRPGRQAVLLIGCYHKQKRYTPANALETACKRAKALRDGKAGTIERKIKLDL